VASNERRNLLKAALIAMGGAVAVGIYIHSCGAYCYAPASPNPTRQELIKRLEKLAQSESPKDLAIGAMCYEMMASVIEETPCPDCKRTKIVGEKDEILRKYNVPLKRIQDRGIQVKLILPDHCPGCGDGLKEKKFQLEIKYPDQPDPVRVELTDGAHDLEIMALFLQGKDRLKHENDAETPLKDQLDRLRELFGVKGKP